MDVSDNAFTGTIPNNLMRLPSIEIFSASKNCLELDISAVCDSKVIRELYLNGLGQSSQCPDKRDPSMTRSRLYELDKCIWAVTSLQKLYISGNGFRGSLDNFQLGNVTELNIHANQIRGTLPELLFHGRSFEVFDVCRAIIFNHLIKI
jgi:Leucine-rich repeat (LRR) protein